MENNINYQNFNYKLYIFLNRDVVTDVSLENIDSSEEIKSGAWFHYINHGIYEERPTQILNNTKTHNGRLGNIFFINMVCHFLALKFNLTIDYKYKSQFNKLGIKFFSGNNHFDDHLYYDLTETNFIEIINFSSIPKNIMITNNIWCQQEDFVNDIKKYWYYKFNQNTIINHNKFKERYKSNDDLFIHVRLGDIKDKTISLEDYYINSISNLKWDRGYIASDSLDHHLCKNLIEKFSLIPLIYDEVETIMFGSTCNKIILSGGTFSWLIGFFAFYTQTIIYPEIKNPWYGKIFENMGWQVLNV